MPRGFLRLCQPPAGLGLAIYRQGCQCRTRSTLPQDIQKAGKIATISKNVSFGKGFDVEMGDFSGLGRRCRIPNNTIIGRFVMMAPEVYVSGGNHRSSRTDIPMCLQGSEDTLPTVIGDDVWIGMRAIIVNGIKIGNGAILSAGCVVTKDIPEYSVVPNFGR